jgi:hypothetical protein
MSNKSKINSIKWTETLEVKINFVEKEVEQGPSRVPSNKSIEQGYSSRVHIGLVEQIG